MPMEHQLRSRPKRSVLVLLPAVSLFALIIATVLLRLLFPQNELNHALIDDVEHGNDCEVHALLARGANANARDMTSIWYRMSTGFTGEPRVTIPYPTALSVLVYACFEKQLPAEKSLNIARDLLDHGAATEEHNREGDTPLMVATWIRREDIVRLLIARGANVNSRNDYGVTPFMQAACSGDTEIMRLMAKHGAALNARDANGCTAFRHALLMDKPKAIATLIELGANMNIKDNANNSPLTIARQEGLADAVKMLQNAGGK
jgi:hypothetical protein